jgi:hypothetical protein
MKCPNLSSYVKNASTNDSAEPQMRGVYRGVPMDKRAIKQRPVSELVRTAGKK